MNVLLTGANGYIGSKIVQTLLGKGGKIIGVDLHSENVPSLANNPNFQFFKADITNAETFHSEIKEADVLIHCAALVHNKSRENYFRVNCEGTKNILNFLDKNRLKQIIFLSTVSVYGDISDSIVPDEDTPANPEDFYGESKLAAENEIKEFSEKYHIPYAIFRLVPVYGDFFLLNINKRIYLPGKMAFYKVGSGEQCLSLVSVNNVVDIVTESIKNRSFFNETFNVRDFEDYSINGIISTFKDIYSQHNKPVVQIPLSVPSFLFKCLGLFAQGRAEFYKLQLNKIALNSLYSAEKLRSTGITLKWNLKNTLKSSSLFMADSR
jgi:nucleoside-diphosphate-sugar epimerase